MDVQPGILSTLDAILRHPLFLILATGLVSGLLIPRLTQRWQDHQKAIETRTRFSSEVTESVVKIVLAVQMAERGAISPESYDEAYHEWEVKRATLGSELRGHFQDGQLAMDWMAFSEEVMQLYILSGTFSEPYRTIVLDKLRKAFPDEEIDWKSLHDFQLKQQGNDAFQTFFNAWWQVREAILVRAGDLTKRILEARTSSFQ